MSVGYMADNDAELRAALLAFCHAAREADPKSFESEEHFAGYVEFILSGIDLPDSGRAEGFRVFYVMYGRYPTFKDFQGGPQLLVLDPPRS
jgi:hypothetical protein